MSPLILVLLLYCGSVCVHGIRARIKAARSDRRTVEEGFERIETETEVTSEKEDKEDYK
jgi:hypothetical protein